MTRPDIQLTEHFRLSEFTRSATADKLNFDNTPNDEQCWHIFQTAVMLEALRQAWGSGIRITSGIRLFELADSSSTSVHPYGWAVDIVPANGKIAEFKLFVRQWLKRWNGNWDQYIDEKRADGAEWVHLGLFNRRGQQRRQFLITTDGKTYKPLNV